MKLYKKSDLKFLDGCFYSKKDHEQICPEKDVIRLAAQIQEDKDIAAWLADQPEFNPGPAYGDYWKQGIAFDESYVPYLEDPTTPVQDQKKAEQKEILREMKQQLQTDVINRLMKMYAPLYKWVAADEVPMSQGLNWDPLPDISSWTPESLTEDIKTVEAYADGIRQVKMVRYANGPKTMAEAVASFESQILSAQGKKGIPFCDCDGDRYDD